jgi:glycosyltransferase involved in cell wall biosynthesis
MHLSRRVIHVADVHEDYEALLRDRGWARGLAALPGRVVAVLGRRSAERATLTAVADTHLVPGAARRVVVRNVPSLPASAVPGPTPRAVYVGDVRASRGLDAMLDAMEAAPAWTLDIVGPIADADAARAAERAASLGGRVTFHGRLAPGQSWAIAAGAWAGFVMLDRTPAFLEATPSKLYEYLAHGIPVVATALPAHEAIVAESGAGVIVADGAAAGEVLRSWSASPDVVRELSARARQWASHSAAFAEGSSVLADRVTTLVGGTHVG